MNVFMSDTLISSVQNKLRLSVLVQDLFDTGYLAQVSALADLLVHSRTNSNVRLISLKSAENKMSVTLSSRQFEGFPLRGRLHDMP